MKISDVIAYHRDQHEFYDSRGDEHSADGEWSYAAFIHAREHKEMAEALEQHHKDLMGIVEAWRIKERENHGCGDFCDGIAHGYDMCSDQLESLINPKD